MLVRVTKEAYYEGRKHIGDVMDFPAKSAKELPSWCVPHDASHEGLTTGRKADQGDEPDTLHGLEQMHQKAKPKPVFDDSAKPAEEKAAAKEEGQDENKADDAADEKALQPSTPPVPKAKGGQHGHQGNKSNK